MKTRKMFSQFFLALAVAIGLLACSKNDEDEIPPPNNEIIAVRLIFADSTANQRSAGSKIDLTKAAWVKIKYAVNDLTEVKEANLILKGDSVKVSTYDMKALAFKVGSQLTIYEAALYNDKETLLGVWSRMDSDIFEVISPEGTSVMDRTYGTVGSERFHN